MEKQLLTKLEKFLYAKNKLNWTCNEEGDIINAKGRKLGHVRKDGYRVTQFKYKKHTYRIYCHQYAYFFFHNEIVPCIDHINRIKTDNRKENLRSVNAQQNAQNRTCKNYSWHKRDEKWQVSLTIDGKRKYFGLYESEDEARQITNELKLKYYNQL